MTISHIGLDQHVATIKFTFFEPTLMYRQQEAHTYLPLEVLVVLLVVLVELSQIFCQFLRRVEVVHVNVRLERGGFFIVFGSCTHHNWHQLLSVKVKEKTFLK